MIREAKRNLGMATGTVLVLALVFGAAFFVHGTASPVMPAMDAVPPLNAPSSIGTGVIGIDNHNPGNVRSWHPQAWPGAVDVDHWHHLIFKRDLDGLKAIHFILAAYGRKHVNTISAIVNRWVGPPRSKKDALNKRGYLRAVAQKMHRPMNAHVNLGSPATMIRLAHAIVYAENGSDPYSDSLYDEAFNPRGTP